ncbi:MAG: hypothetical protein DMF90_28165, partial [Acidobacteria bacterium]
METSKTTPRSIRGWSVAMLAIAIAMLVGSNAGFSSRGNTVTAQTGNEMLGMGAVTGTVTASKPFKAAHVYLR